MSDAASERSNSDPATLHASGDTLLQEKAELLGPYDTIRATSGQYLPPNATDIVAVDCFTDSDFGFLSPSQESDEIGRLGTYRVLKVLGKGGMGTVFQAEDLLLQRMVALKVMKPEMLGDLAARTRFLREARAAAAIKHDHIVTIYQVGQENDVPYLAMEYLEGEPLENRLRRKGPLPLAEAFRIGREIAQGLDAAHERNLIHRDIKPANIWLEGETARVKILDFGLARPATGQTHLTATGFIMGTPNYMAPEQARGAEVDQRTDLFSLGCVLYCMCTGRSPFSGDSIMAVLTSLAVDEPPPLINEAPGVPPTFSELVGQLLKKDLNQRPPSARVVVERIAAIELNQTQPTAVVSQNLEIHARSGDGVHRLSINRKFTRNAILAAVTSLTLLGATALVCRSLVGAGSTTNTPVVARDTTPIKIGVLLPLSGTLAVSGAAVLDATALAVDEINQEGGVLGRPVEAIIRDSQSLPPICADEAEKLIVEDQVCTLFGIWTSSDRKTVKPIVEKYDHLLFYPVQYEGLEQSPNIVYCGAAPNQQIVPAVQYCFGFLGKRRFFLVGSDYVFPRTANAIIREELKVLGAQLVGEEYLPLGCEDVAAIVKKIVEAKPDVILSTINGNSNNSFFRALRRAGVTPATIPTLSFSIAEQELRTLDLQDMIGDYAAWNYFQSVDRPQNQEFVRRFQARYGPQRVLTDPMEAGYFSVYLWAQAVESAGRDDPRAIREAVKNQSFDAPGGTVRIDPENQHAWKVFRLGRIVEGGQFDIISSSEKPIRPEPFPRCRSREAWSKFLNDMFQEWGGQWERPRS
jgi:urea transport system substrate-binding protein